MQSTATILLYVGAILIGVEAVGKMGYLSTLILLPLTYGLKPLANKLMEDTRKNNSKRQLVKKTLLFVSFIIYGVTVLIGSVLLSPFLIVEYLIGQPLLLLNEGLNKLLLVSISPWKENLFAQVRAGVKGRQTTIEPTDDNIWQILQKSKIPFLGIFGIICVTIGFIFQLLS